MVVYILVKGWFYVFRGNKAYNSLLSKAANIQDVFSIIDKIDNELDLVLIAKSLLNDISILKVIEGSSKEISLLMLKLDVFLKE